ncbi:MAG: XdhC family protein [Nitrososphaerales archaeon]
MKEFLSKVQELISKEERFCIATVVRTQGSTSAKGGSKMIIGKKGEILYGWIGGGCAESIVLDEALKSMKDGETRYLSLSMEDEVTGTGMPCGGSMDVYLEPYIPNPKLLILGHGKIAETLSKLATIFGFDVIVNDPLADESKFPDAKEIFKDDMNYEKIKVSEDTYIIILTMHKSDDKILKKVLGKGAKYIALVASRNRTKIIMRYLLEDGVSEEMLKEVNAPAGLDLGAKTPEEIALSIMAEIVMRRRGGSGKPLVEVKKITIEELKEQKIEGYVKAKSDSEVVGLKC